MALSTTVFVLVFIAVVLFFSAPLLFYASTLLFFTGAADSVATSLGEKNAVAKKAYFLPVMWIVLAIAPLVLLVVFRTRGSI